MNHHWKSSPIGQTNEIPTKKGTPKQDESARAEDLQKLRRSNHSSHHSHRREVMDDDEHDDIVKGLLYPGIHEDSENDEFDCDFFEEDLETAQAAVLSTGMPPPFTSDGTSSYANNTDNTSNSNNAYNLPSIISEQNMSAYERSYFATMGRPYYDLTNEKLGR